MRLKLIRWIALLLFCCSLQAANKTAVDLLLGQTAATPGSTLPAALRMRSEPDWHTYWRNPGDSGYQTTVEWELPPGVTVSSFDWPVPEKLSITQLDSYVFEGEVLLPFTISIPASAPAGPIQLKASVNWLECSADACVPAKAKISAQLEIAAAPVNSPALEAIQKGKQLLPPPAGPEHAPRALLGGELEPDKRRLTIEWTPKSSPEQPDFFPYESEAYSISPGTKVLEATPAKIRIETVLTKTGDAWPAEITGLLLDRSRQHQAVVANLKLDQPQSTPASSASATATSQESESPTTLALALLLAFVGGIILNIMPCVLPVVALKILSFVNQSGHNPSKVRKLGLIYGLGVLTSFLVLALLAVIVQRGGQNASWGMQMQSPIFVTVLMTILLLASLNLFGVFEFNLGGRAMGTASELASREGPAGAFFNGVFTTLLATPCTAPALSVALGFAYAQPPFVLILILLTVGVGLALPYVFLCFFPAWLKFLPKPGDWMEKFKKAMAFPLLATIAWLLWVATDLFGEDAILWLGLYFVLLALAGWMFGDLIQRGTARKPLSWGVLILVLAGAFGYVLEHKLHWRNPPPPASPSSAKNIAGLEWKQWTPDAIAAARQAGHVVFVDFTAKWCLTCQANKKALYATPEFASALKAVNGVAFIADYTRPSPEITAELAKHNRRGVPLNVLYPADISKPPIILPANVVKNSGPVFEALKSVAPKK